MTTIDNTNFRIIGLDPGGTTGWATFTAARMYDPEYEKMEYFDHKFECGYLGPAEHHEELEGFIEYEQVENTLVVCESFNYRNATRAKVELISREYIGVAKLICRKRKIHFLQQNSSQGKITKDSFVRKVNLERLGLWVSPYSTWKHSMDAYGHILYYMIHNDILKEELLELGWK